MDNENDVQVLEEIIDIDDIHNISDENITNYILDESFKIYTKENKDSKTIYIEI